VVAGGPGTSSSPAATDQGPVATLPPKPSSTPEGSTDPRLDPVLVGAGDIARCDLPGAEQTATLVEGIAGTVFTAGDNAYNDGSAKQYATCYAPTWGRFLKRTLIPAPGNHDYNTSGAAGYKAFFGSLATPNGTTWYSVEVGSWHVIVLDSNCAEVGGCGPRSAQGRWLSADLAASAATRCTLAIFHHPRFSSGEHGNDPEVGPFWDALYAAHADLIVNGHDHDYERFAPQNAAGQEDRAAGIREFVVGTGGGEQRQFVKEVANSELRVAGVWGVIELRLHPTSYDWAFDPAGGSAIGDTGRGPCH
jgi:hypothetical protein